MRYRRHTPPSSSWGRVSGRKGSMRGGGGEGFFREKGTGLWTRRRLLAATLSCLIAHRSRRNQQGLGFRGVGKGRFSIGRVD